MEINSSPRNRRILMRRLIKIKIKNKFSVKWGWQAYTTPQRVFKIAFL